MGSDDSLHRLRGALIALPRAHKTAVLLLADLAGFFLCGLVAFWLVFASGEDLHNAFAVALLVSGISLVVGWVFGFYESIVRFMDDELLVVICVMTTVTAVLGAGIAFSLGLELHPLRWGLTYATLALFYSVISRKFASRFLRIQSRFAVCKNVVIYGAGTAGAMLAKQLRDHSSYWVAAFIDDDHRRQGSRVGRLPIYPPDMLGTLAEKHDLSTVLLALPSVSRARRREIISGLSEYSLELRSMPNVADLVSGKAQVDDLQPVSVEDLLGREAVPPNEALLAASIKDKSVMITGAGGSIGSELCRQALLQNPSRLVLFERSEPALYEIEQELITLQAEKNIDCPVVALIGDVADRVRVLEVLQTFDVDTVYHAAAYKHVPLVELNVLEGARNNILGTWNTACAAVHAGVSTFVLISTDKAVSPTNFMGASKRFAELCLQAMQEETETTKFCMVRFGNVLESSGSVIPRFRRQIRAGGPVTVTHRDIIRYFMTIPEATQLVMQAASMESSGDVFVLDMGSPIKIDTLARQMIKLSGLTIKSDSRPDGDIEIVYTGLRPAEKLYEELLIGNDVSGTEHARIMRANEESIPFEEFAARIKELEFLIKGRDCHLV
ncbi:MAG: polysaccharide biosynthesis protein, partial [Chromatiales bacterium]|nr:polysaccharide biosynthesis protein [Chromatiales bacterium]